MSILQLQQNQIRIFRVLWSRPIPLSWYFKPQWENEYGEKWSEHLCNRWLIHDRQLKNFTADLPTCPCSLEHALTDKGRFSPDPGCNKDANPDCPYNKGAVHCVISGVPK